MANLQVAKCGEVNETNEFDYSSDPLDSKTRKSGLTSCPARIPRDFTITTDSYISLCSRVYNALCTAQSSFGQAVPESAFQYWAICLLWARFAKILPICDKIGSTFFTEMACLDDLYLTHSPFVTYFRGIGNFSDPDGIDRQFRLPAIPTTEKIAGVPYTFGEVNAKTHFLYEALPAPGIAALRMLADVNYTLNTCEENLLWDLPSGLRPDIQESQVESVKPTKNLIGWAPAKHLNDQQLKLLLSLDIEKSFSSSDIRTKTLYELCSSIYTIMFSERRDSLRFDYFSDLPVHGSVAQGATIEKHDRVSKFDRSAMYCEGMLSVSSPYKLTDTLNGSAVVFGYRMMKEAIGDRHCWSCYDFDEYKHVPESWIRSRNTVYNYGDVGRLNETVYSTSYILKRKLQSECLRYSLFESPEQWNSNM